MNSSKKRSAAGYSGREYKLSTENVIDGEFKLLKPKRRKGDNFTLSIPSRSKQICQVFAIGSNEFTQCGMEGLECFKQLKHIKSLEKFKIVDISTGSLHNAALTFDGKIVTWGINDHGKLH
jgi:regulator of chromosome condensation